MGGVMATVRGHTYAFTAASGFSGIVTDRATNASVRVFTVERDMTPQQ